MWKKITAVSFISCFMLFLSNTHFAQIDSVWTKTINHDYRDTGVKVVEAHENNLFIIGTSISSTYNQTSLLIKTDSLGIIQWKKEFPAAEFGRFTDLVKSKDSSLYIVGAGYNFGKIYKTNFNGDILWESFTNLISTLPDTIYIMDEDTNFTPEKLLLAEDNGVYLLGKSGELESRIWTAKYSSTGELEWANSFPNWGMINNRNINFIKSNNGFFIQSSMDAFVLFYLTDEFGNLIEQKLYNEINVHSQSYNSLCLSVYPDTAYVLVGEQMGDFAMLRVDRSGTVLWGKSYPRYTPSMNYGNKVIRSPKGGFVIIGGTGDNENPKSFIVQTDFEGNIEWENVYDNSYGEDIAFTHDNGLIACGTYAKSDIWLTKLESTPLAVVSGESNWIDSDWNGFASGILNGSSSYSPNGFEITNYVWSQNDSILGTDSSTNLNLPTGTNKIQLKVTDASGVSGINPFEVNVCSYKLETNGSISSSISTIGDSIFFATSTDDQIYCFDRNNNLKWTLATGGDIQSTTTIGPNGNIYVGSDDTRLYCFDPLGNFKWDTPMGGVVSASPAVNQDRTIYVGTENNRLYSVNGTSGEINWNYLTGGPITSSASISSDGDIYFGSIDKKFYSLSSTGSLNWSYTTNGEIHSSPAIDTLGRIYFGSNDAKLYALNMDGSLAWSFASGMAIKSSPVIDENGNIYFGSADSYFYCLDNSGNEVWKYQNESAANGNPSLTQDGNVIYGCENGEIVSLDKDGNLNWSYKTNSAVQSAPLITEEGRIYVGSTDNSVYGFIDPENAEINLKHQWPTFQKDTKRSGSQTELVTSIGSENIGVLPTEFQLMQNYPNPFNPVTTINYSIPVNVNAKNALVKLKVYDVLGKEIVTLVNENQTPGYYKVDFNASYLASGIYYYQITYGSYIKTLKMLLLK